MGLQLGRQSRKEAVLELDQVKDLGCLADVSVRNGPLMAAQAEKTGDFRGEDVEHGVARAGPSLSARCAPSYS